MLSNQVKRRIAYNKSRRALPSWKREMRDFVYAQLPSAQSMLSSKHLPGELAEANCAALKSLYEHWMNLLNTFTRQDWDEFRAMQVPAYTRYLQLRQLTRSPLMHIQRMGRIARSAAADVAKMPYDPRLAERRKLIEGLTQEQINKAYQRPALHLPSCKCGAMVGHINVGVTCKACNTMVRVPKERDAEGEYLHVYGRLPLPVSPEVRTVIDSTLQERAPTPFEQNQIDLIQRGIADPNTKWVEAFKPVKEEAPKPKKQGE